MKLYSTTQKLLSSIVALLIILSAILIPLNSFVSANEKDAGAFDKPIIGSSKYDFENASDYIYENNSNGKYYGYITGNTLSGGISVSDGVLKLNSGSTNAARTVQTWVVNKNGRPFELVPGIEYTVSFDIKQTASPVKSTTYISLSNGICLNDDVWFGNLGASASVMPESDITLNYMTGNKQTTSLDTYPNNALNYNVDTNHVCYVKNGRALASADGEKIQKTFVAYDITANGTDNNCRNYLALTFGLYKGQNIEIDNLTVTYDYSKYTAVTFVNGDSSETNILKVDDVIANLADVGDKSFVGWFDEQDQLHSTVPTVPESGMITLTAKWSSPFNEPVTIGNENDYSLSYDFDTSSGDKYILSGKYSGYKNNASELEVDEKALKVTSSANNSVQLWVLNKNGIPFVLKDGMTYSVSFKLSYTGMDNPGVSIANGIDTEKNGWNGVAPVSAEEISVLGSGSMYKVSVTASDVTDNGSDTSKKNYLAFVFDVAAGQTVKIEDISITYDYTKHTLVTYQYDPTDASDTETIFQNVGSSLKSVDYVGDRKFICWKYENEKVDKVKASASTGKILLVAELEADALEGLTRYDFNKANQYEINNTNGKYVTTYYGGIGTDCRPFIESGIDVSDGKLKLTSGLKNSVDYKNTRTVKAWVINKKGIPFEFTQGVTYSINFTLKQNGTPVKGTYLAIANGVCFSDSSWTDHIGASASVMSKTDNITYEYKTGNDWQYMNKETTPDYPNNAVRASNLNKVAYGSTEEGITATEVSMTFTAYDISAKGADYKNYIALVYSLSGDQEIEIDDISIHESDKATIVTYDYKNGTTKKVYQQIGDEITIPDSTNIPNGKKQDGWHDTNGNVYKTVPKGTNGRITLYPNLVRTAGNNNVRDPLKMTLDFEFDDEYEISNSTDATFVSLYKGGISTELQSLVSNDISIENGALRFGSGISEQAYENGGTPHNIQTWVINSGGAPIELKPGKKYTVNFKLKQTSSPLYSGISYVALSNGVCYKDGPWTNTLGASASVMKESKETYEYKTGTKWRYGDLAEYPNNAVKSTNTNKLIYSNTNAGLSSKGITTSFVAYDITNNGNKENYKNYLAITVALCAGQEIEIDDFIIYETDSYTFVSYDLGGFGEMDSFFCEKGDRIKLNNLSDTSEAHFLGWYTDPLYLNPVKNNVYTVGTEDIVFYAKFAKFTTVEDFENYSGNTNRTEGKPSWNAQVGYYSFITDSFSNGGTHSLHINAIGDETNSTWIKLTDNGKDFTVSEGQTYLFTVDYYVENANNDIELYPAVSGTQKIWQQEVIDGKNKSVYKYLTDYTMLIARSDKGKGWKQLTFEFSPKLVYPNYNTVYFRFDNITKGTSIYFDNFKAQLVTSNNSLVSIYPNNGENPIVYLGTPGQSFNMPTLTSKYMTFKGWYTDVKFNNKYTGNGTFNYETLSLYAKWQYKNGVKITEGFEDYKGILSSSDFSIVSNDHVGGSKCLKYEFEPRSKTQYDFLSLYIDSDIVPISNGQRFAMSFKYKIMEDRVPDTNLPIGFSTANKTQLKIEQYNNFLYWTWNYVPGEWHLFNDILTAEKLKSGDNILKFEIGSMGSFKGTVYIEDICLIPLQEDDVVLTLYTDQLSTNLPTHYITKPGVEISFPTSASRTVGNWFLGGWCTDKNKNDLITNESIVLLPGQDLKVWARWCKKSIYEGFENDFAESSGAPGLKNIGSDYEIYNRTVKDFNRANVKTGSNSLHRIGKSHLWKNTQVLVSKNTLAVGRKYSLSLNVKMDKSLHTDGSVRIASNIVQQTGYDTIGEYMNIVNIADLTDNQWHNVTFNFVALSEFLSISTPGYCSLYFDDLQIKLLSDDAEVSNSVYCDSEYEPLLRDSNGNVIKVDTVTAKLNDASLKVETNSDSLVSSKTLLIAIVVSACVLIGGGAVCTVLFIKRKRKRMSVK